jgi:hypothetical protein
VPVAGAHVDLVLLVFVAACFSVVVYIVLLSSGVVRSLICMLFFDVLVIYDAKYGIF